MESHAVETTEDPRKAKKSMSVLVTGFAPFRADHPHNPSSIISSSLPASITIHSDTEDSSNGPRKDVVVNILAYPSAVHVAYASVDEMIPAIYLKDSSSSHVENARTPAATKHVRQYDDVDLIVHVGMATGSTTYTVERLARGLGYEIPDVDKMSPINGEHGARRRARENHAPELPAETLWTDIDVAAICKAIREDSGLSSVEPSEDAGLYLCEYIYYASLAHFRYLKPVSQLETRSKKPSIVFLHVPGSADDKVVETGRAVVIALIRALALDRIANLRS